MPDTGDSIDNILGEEFLTWLWFKSDTQPDSFHDEDGQPFNVFMEQRIVVQGGQGQAREVATASGCLSALKEAKFGLATGKKVSRALIRFEKGSLVFQFVIRAEDFALASVKTPKLEKDGDDEPDALFLEKIYLLETCLHLLDTLYATFLKLRISSGWRKEVTQIGAWLRRM